MRKFFHALMRQFQTSRLPQRRRPVLELEQLEDRTVPTVATPNALVLSAAQTTPSGLLSPTQVRQAYAFNQIFFNNIHGAVQGDGSGQTIAIVDAYNQPNVVSDLQAFDAYYGMGNPLFSVVNENGGTSLPSNAPPPSQGNGGWGTEISLDVEWAHAVAPGAKILLVECLDQTADLLTGVNYAAKQPGVSVISMSWATGEFSGEASFDNYFTTPSGHNGITYVAASGDNGSQNAQNGFGPNWPAVSNNVLAVGGTQLSVDSAGDYLGETAWSGSGGGVSVYEKNPIFQNTSTRTVPDVSYNANVGFAIYDSYDNTSSTPWSGAGGTSAGAPQWSALIAIADQGRVLAGESTLISGTQTLPILYQLPASDFHDITSGSNGAYSAGTGYDLVTGRGSPIANLIVAGLVGQPSGNPSQLVVDGAADVFGEFHGNGVWEHKNTVANWQQLTPSDASLLAVDANGDVFADFAGYGVQKYSGGQWTRLSTSDVSLLAVDANGDVFADFAGYGVQKYSGGVWTHLSTADASLLTVDANGDVFADFAGYGVQEYSGGQWKLL